MPDKNLTGIPNPVSSAMGFGMGDALKDQTLQETEEERRKRLLGIQQQAQASPIGSVLSGPMGIGAVSRGLLGR